MREDSKHLRLHCQATREELEALRGKWRVVRSRLVIRKPK